MIVKTMLLGIVGIVDRGVNGRERLHLSVLADTNLNYYAVFDTDYSGDGIVPRPKRTFWFNDYPVRAGDHVILYTKIGTPSTKPRTDGGTNHFFYWDIGKPLWGSATSCAVLVELSNWVTTEPA
jgi:hypothetical protein